MNEQLVQRIRECPSLPSLPAIAMQVLELAQKPDVDIVEIAKIISKDPALSSKILRTVNSSFYGRSQHVATVSHALVILGLQSVKTLVLGFTLVMTLSKAKGKGFRHLAYWKRSIFAATAARMIAGRVSLVQQEEAFLAALLKDIGILVLGQVLGDQYGEIYASAKTHQDLPAVEMQALGMTHADVGGMLAEQWRLPPLLAMPIAHHHSPEQVTDSQLRKLTELVRLSGRCADVFVDDEPAQAIAMVRQSCHELYRMSASDADALLADIGTRTKEVASLFDINIGSALEYEAVLKKANDALVVITLQSQQQASTLQQQNKQLLRQATTDGLTGLSNRALLDGFLAEQFNEATRRARPLSLLMLDLDNFKHINDTHGHQAGDEVLRMMGKLLRAAAKPTDLPARYGGEELAVVLPGVTRLAAASLAETIRRAAAAREINCGKVSVPVTVSIGVATFEPGGPFRDVAHLVKAADLAVYAAKRAGRNCVRVFGAAAKSVPGAAA
jgi:diguanylate cyclase (GGDEF)-like protein